MTNFSSRKSIFSREVVRKLRAQVLLSKGCPARWQLLQERLEGVCPTEAATVPLWRRNPRALGGRNPYFLLEVSAPDCVGILHGGPPILQLQPCLLLQPHACAARSLSVAGPLRFRVPKNLNYPKQDFSPRAQPHLVACTPLLACTSGEVHAGMSVHVGDGAHSIPRCTARRPQTPADSTA